MKEYLKKISWVVISTYALSCGILYMIGFWSFFDINVLQFVDAKDILKSVAIPLGTAVIIYAANLVLHSYNIPDEEKSELFIKEGGIFKIWIYFTRTIVAVMALAMGIMILLDIFYFPPQYRIRGFGSSLSIILFVYLSFKTDFLVGTGKFRPMVIVFICFLPLMSLQRGLYDGKQVMDGEGTYLVTSDSECLKGSHSKYRYISTLSDKAFALSLNDLSICIFKYNYLKLQKEQPIATR